MNPEASKAVVRELIEHAFNRRDLDTIERLFAPEIAADIRRHATELLDAFPDLNVRIDDLVAEGDRVAARFTITGTHAARYAGLPATNRRVTWNSFRWYRLADGRVVHTWAIQDRLGLLEQIGGSAGGSSQVSWAGELGTTNPPPRR